MLSHLAIRDFVIVDTLELDFSPGFGALTGETGAGKSILVDALGFVLGSRADAGLVRPGRERAEVTALFDVAADSPLQGWLDEQDMAGEPGELLLRRVQEAGGRSRAFLNGRVATAAQLREAGEALLDIHGQHAHQSLMREDTQRALLDAHAGAEEEAGRVAGAFREWNRLRQALEDARRNASASEKEREHLAWQVKELEALAFDPAQWAETQAEHRRMAHAAALAEGVEAALEGLSEGELTALALLEGAAARLRSLVDFDAGLREALDLLDSSQVQMQEAAYALRHYHDRLERDPAALAELERRLGQVHDLARKHRVAAEDLPALRASLEARLQALSDLADPALLEDRLAAARRDYDAAATALSARRRDGAGSFGAGVTRALQELAMPGGRFDVALQAEDGPTPHGAERVAFHVAPHEGQPLSPLAKTASGGELSRISLAIQVMAGKASQVPTLVFDEVDVGIGGRVAEIVGRLLKDLGRSHQVLCVTHLPQVAARADWQWSISKADGPTGVASRVAVLDGAGRVEEIARMLGGVHITDTTRRHAREMLGV